MLIAAEKITKQFGETPLFNGCSLFVQQGDKIGIIGRNGSGKSTFLSILAQALPPDSGTITLHSNFRQGYLPQIPQLTPTNTVLQQVLADAAQAGTQAEEYEAKHILHNLGLTQLDQPVGTLSGGQQKRVALASVLLTRCELLLLDEPTNHLDDEMIRWLESYLIQYKGALLMVTHDRYFLDRVVSKIAEVHRGELYLHQANYSQYLELRAQREEQLAGTERKRQSLLRKELAWMQQGAKARGTKSRSRIQRYEKLEAQAAPPPQDKLELQSVQSRLGRKTIQLEQVSKGYGDRQLIRHFDLVLHRDARIGIVGPNGCGKSTLLKIIGGLIAPDSGQVVVGETVKIGYFAQDCGEMDPAMRVIDYVKTFGESLDTPTGSVTAAQMLEQFLFPGDLQWNTIGRLSGGERRRLYLLGILMTAPNILLLDEPTNDLDIDTLLVLEDYLEQFGGAVLLISHDRYFLDKTTHQILEFQGDGSIEQYLGGYSHYLEQRPGPPQEQLTKPAKEKPKQAQSAPRAAKVRFSFNEQREFDEIDQVIAQLEQEQARIQQAIAQCASDFEQLQSLLALQETVEQQLSEKTDRWLYLNEIADQIAQQSQTKE